MKLFKSFNYAWHGIQYCYKTQLNFKIHIIVMIIVIGAGFALRISDMEWLAIIVSSMLVLAFELLNTAIEQLCDTITKDIHPVIKTIKDSSAAAVLIGAAGSVLIGLIIFLPKIHHLLKS